MTAKLGPDQEGALFARTAFRAMPLRLSARLASGRVRVGRLRELGPGDVLPLDTVVGEPARLLAGGVVVGAGEIVEIHGRLALRITRVGDAAPAHAEGE